MTSSEGLRNREGERFRSFEVDDQLELGRLFDGEIGGLCAFQYFVGVGHCAAKKNWEYLVRTTSADDGPNRAHLLNVGYRFLFLAKIRFQFSL